MISIKLFPAMDNIFPKWTISENNITIVSTTDPPGQKAFLAMGSMASNPDQIDGIIQLYK
jgi:hypothetical protein